LIEVAALYDRLPAHRYLDRWSLVQLVTSLEDPASLTFLDEILSSALPPEESKKPATYSTVGQEVIIRTTAIEAVDRLAAGGDTQALEVLLKHTRHHNFSVKRAAIQSYLAQGGKHARQALLKALPVKDHHILDIRRADVHEVPQPKVEARSGRDPNELPPRSTLGKREHRSR
jgi:HEAT repeat protein